MIFSYYIRYRDNWQCVKCGTHFPERAQNLACSHFKSRRHESLRYEPMNCDALCVPCHDYVERGGGQKEWYEPFKLAQLGQREYDLLELQANTGYQKADEFIARIVAKEFIKQLEAERGIKIRV